MKRVNEILTHPQFQEKLAFIERQEEDRVFCKHGLEHLLDVARLAYICNLERGGRLNKEVIYGAALLHDIGRSESGQFHHKESAAAAEAILSDCGFSNEEKTDICNAILCHRDWSVKDEQSLRGVLYKADKESRCCFHCRSAGECNWEWEKRNLELQD